MAIRNAHYSARGASLYFTGLGIICDAQSGGGPYSGTFTEAVFSTWYITAVGFFSCKYKKYCKLTIWNFFRALIWVSSNAYALANRYVSINSIILYLSNPMSIFIDCWKGFTQWLQYFWAQSSKILIWLLHIAIFVLLNYKKIHKKNPLKNIT